MSTAKAEPVPTSARLAAWKRHKATPAKPPRIMFARAIEASVSGDAPDAARLWRAGWNKTDKGDLNFTPRSAELVLAAFAARGNPLVWYYEHEDQIPLAERGGCPMKGACSAPSSTITARKGADGPECWGEQIAWTDEARRQIISGERRQLSPIAAFDSDTREIVEILNVSLCSEGATHFGTILASAGRETTNMDQMIQAVLDALNAGDYEKAEAVIEQMEAAEGGAGYARMARGMVAKMKAEAAKPPPPPPAPPADDTAVKKLAATREAQAAALVSADVFTRKMAALDIATQKAEDAVRRSDRATTITLIAANRDAFPPAVEREYLDLADPIATERHIRTTAVLHATGKLAAARGAHEAKPPGNDPKGGPVDTCGLDEIEMGEAARSGISFKAFAASKKKTAARKGS